MTVVNRWYQILQLLVTHKEMRIGSLKQQLNTSTQTVKTSIESLNEELIGIAEIVQHKNDFHIEIENFEKFDLIMNGSLRRKSDFNSCSKRVFFIVKKLIEQKDFLLIDDLSEALGVSRSTVVKDLRVMKKLISSFNVEVIGTPNRGLRMRGEELDLRLLHLHYVQEYFAERPLSERTQDFVKHLVQKFNLPKNQGLLLKKTISITMKRLLKGNILVDLPNEYMDLMTSHPAFVELIHHLEYEYSITLSQTEQAFLSFPLNISATAGMDKSTIDEQKIEQLFQQMIETIHQNLLVEFDETFLVHEIKEHFIYMLNRLIFRIELQDLFYGEIESQYPLAYELAKIGLQQIGEQLQRVVPTVEISYIAFYFELALRKQTSNNEHKEIAIVCNTGKGTALIIRRQLERVLGPQISMVHFSEEEYQQEDLDQYFAVFTTIPLKNVKKHTPIIRLINLFNETWLQEEWRKAEKLRAANVHHLKLDFEILNEKKPYKQNLDHMLESLESKGLVDQEFKEQLFIREKLRSTIFEYGIAFPHAINKKSAEIILSVGIFRKGISTINGQVQVVLLLAIPQDLTMEKEKELLKLYDQLFAVIGDPEFRSELCRLDDLVGLQNWMIRKGVIT